MEEERGSRQDVRETVKRACPLCQRLRVSAAWLCACFLFTHIGLDRFRTELFPQAGPLQLEMMTRQVVVLTLQRHHPRVFPQSLPVISQPLELQG